MGKPAPKIFAREATGLVKEVGGWSSFLANWMLVTGGVPILILQYYYVYPGANFELAFLLSFLPTLALAGMYTIFSLSMPRSGGDYIFVSRGLHPFLGFVNSFSLYAGYLLSGGVYSTFLAYYFVYELFTLGIFGHNSSLINLATSLESPTSLFVIALIILLISFGIAVVRPRYAWGAIFWIGVVSMVCTLVMFVVLATINQASFAQSYNNFVTTQNQTLSSLGFANLTTYQQTIQVGGWSPPKSVIGASLSAYALAWYSYTWYTLPSTWAGEIKQARKNIPIAILWAVVWIAVYYILFLWLVNRAFGQPFLTSWSALTTNSNYSLPYDVNLFVPFFTYIMYPSAILSVILLLAFFLPNFMSNPPLLISGTRYMFAWSFDRVLPERISAVSERLRTPVLATVIALLVNIPGAVIASFYPSATPSAIVPLFTFGYILPALAGISFPFLRKELYEAVFVVKRKILGLPVITWLGIVCLVSLAVGTYSLFIGGFMNFKLPDYVFYYSVYSIGALIFVASYLIRRRQGVNLSLAFKEIPPE